jgi:Protein of unknown function (DUF3568)
MITIRHLRFSFVSAALFAVMLAASGCVALLVGGAAGAGGAAYVYGELKELEPASLEKTWSAAQAAVGDLQFAVNSMSKDALEGKLVAKTADDRTITVHFKKTSDSSTEVRIRVGTFGDEALSRTLLEKLRSHL